MNLKSEQYVCRYADDGMFSARTVDELRPAGDINTLEVNVAAGRNEY